MSSHVAHDLTNQGGTTGPAHVAIIMDGNGRWAKKRLLPRIAGHRQGVEAIRRVVAAAPGLGIDILTLYAFSSENWKRPQDEVNDLMGLLRHYLRQEIAELHARNVRVEVIGEYRRLQPDLVALIEDARALTRGNGGLTLVIALNYGARGELARVAQQLAAEARAGTLDPASIDEAMIESRLDTAGLPAPDLLIRTSGEVRLSNFLLWQLAYSELRFVDTLWPDFDEAALAEAVADYGGRERRFGGL